MAVVVDHEGVLQTHREVPHTTAGLRALTEWYVRHGVGRVAIERAGGPVVDALVDSGLTVYVVHPRQMKHLRARYGSAGNKDDVLDAFVLADVLRTDWRRLRPLERDTDPTRALRSLTRARKDLVKARVA